MIYIFVFITSTFFAWLASRSKDKGVIVLCSVISILIPSILGGLRAYSVGTDTRIYGQPDADAALHAESLSELLHDRVNEPVYLTIVYVLMNTLGHVNWCYFAYQVITISGIYITAYRWKEKIPLHFMMLIWFLRFYNQTYNIMRQYMAASIILIGMYALERRDYKKFMLYILAAYFFHRSSLINIVLIIAAHFVMASDTVHKNVLWKMLLFSGMVATMVIMKPLMLFVANMLSIGGKYMYYFSETFDNRPNSKTMILVFMTTLMMIALYRKRAEYVLSGAGGCKGNVEFYKFNLVFVAIYSIAVRFYSDRLLIYADLINTIPIAAIPSFIKEKHLRFMAYMGVLAVIAWMWYVNCVRFGFSETWPYRSIL